jgi:GAF domain-containing protein
MKESEYNYLKAFISITRTIGSSLDLKEVLQKIVKSICEITYSKGCTLMLLDERGERLEMKSFHGLSEQYVKKGPLLADKSISDTLLGKPVIIEDAGSDPRVQYPQAARQEGIASIASFPIVLKERIIGVLRLYTSIRCRFTEDDIEFLSALAMQCGIAIENAKMYEQVKTNYEKSMVPPLSNCVRDP